jgi:hypothetical protein
LLAVHRESFNLWKIKNAGIERDDELLDNDISYDCIWSCNNLGTIIDCELNPVFTNSSSNIEFHLVSSQNINSKSADIKSKYA